MPGVLAALIVFIVENPQDFGVLCVLWSERVHFQVTKLSGEIQMLLSGNLLITEEENLIVNQCRAECCSQFIADGLLQIDAIDSGADVWA